jgi:hypothetical protein
LIVALEVEKQEALRILVGNCLDSENLEDQERLED